MTITERNPYAPPVDNSIVTEKRPSKGSIPFTVVALLCSLAFVAFTIILLQSTNGDRKAGMLFCGNIPVMIALVVAATRSVRIAGWFAAAVVAIQCGISVALLVLGIGELVPVLVIDSIIILPFAALATWARFFERQSKRRSPGY